MLMQEINHISMGIQCIYNAIVYSKQHQLPPPPNKKKIFA